MAFTVTPEKLYVSDGQDIYSVNADGSGKQKIADGISAVSGCMRMYDNMLYGIEPLASAKNRSRGTLARVSLSGGKVETLDIGVSGAFEIRDGVLYASFGETLTATDLATLDTTEYDLDSDPETVLWWNGHRLCAELVEQWRKSVGQHAGTSMLYAKVRWQHFGSRAHFPAGIYDSWSILCP